MKFIDAHAHTYLRGMEDLAAMENCGISHAVVCAFFPVKPRGASTLIDLFNWIDTVERERLNKTHIEMIFAAGIHPRSIPPETDVEDILSAIRQLIEAKHAHAIGEIGLETGETSEGRILARQLKLAAELQVPAVIHTPRENKVVRVHQTLELMAEAGISEEHVVLDHMTKPLIDELRARGHGVRFGLTLQPGKTTANDVFQILQNHGPQGILLNTDCSHAASNPCALAECAQQLLTWGVSPEDIAQLTFENAFQFFKLGEG